MHPQDSQNPEQQFPQKKMPRKQAAGPRWKPSSLFYYTYYARLRIIHTQYAYYLLR